MSFAFAVTGVSASFSSVAPALLFRVTVTQRDPSRRVHALALRAQIQIDSRQRRYSEDEQARLLDVFGPPALWDRSLKPLVWGHAALLTPSFEEQVEVELSLPCTYDFEVAAAKYLHAIGDGEIPLSFLFTGTAFLAGESGAVFEPIPWDADASYRMPVGEWRQAMDAHFPGGAWIRVSRETLDALHAYRSRQAWPDWDRAFDALLYAAEDEGETRREGEREIGRRGDQGDKER